MSTQFDAAENVSPELAGKYERAYAKALAEERLKLDIDMAASAVDGLETYTGTPEGNAHCRAMVALQNHIARPTMTWEVMKARHIQHVATMAFAKAVGL